MVAITHHTFAIKGHVWLETSEGLVIGYGRKLLLEQIDRCGSIMQAAKTLGISYRRAWAMVRAMNRSSNWVIVEKQTGGINGGGAKLTMEGKQMVMLFDALAVQFDLFKSNTFSEQ